MKQTLPTYTVDLLMCVNASGSSFWFFNIFIGMGMHQLEHAREIAHQAAESEKTAWNKQMAALEEQKAALNSAWRCDKEAAMKELKDAHDQAMSQVLYPILPIREMAFFGQPLRFAKPVIHPPHNAVRLQPH